MSKPIGGPYFKGQEPHKCGHYYPDVVLVRDFFGKGGVMMREFDCCICKQTHTVEIPDSMRHTVKSPKPKTPEELQAFRVSERRRLMKK